jgi:hypothetical protein
VTNKPAPAQVALTNSNIEAAFERTAIAMDQTKPHAPASSPLVIGNVATANGRSAKSEQLPAQSKRTATTRLDLERYDVTCAAMHLLGAAVRVSCFSIP